MSIEDTHQKLKVDLSQLVMHWYKLADHIKQGPLARKVILSLSKELQKVLEKY